MNLHLERLGAACNRLADMAITQQADGFAAHFVMGAVGGSRPIGPAALSQVVIGLLQGHVAGQNGAHHIFGNRLFVTEAVAHDGGGWQGRQINRVITRTGHMEQFQVGRLWQAGVESDADDDIGSRIGGLFLRGSQHIGQQSDAVAGADKG